jgi:hypothetical protein
MSFYVTTNLDIGSMAEVAGRAQEGSCRDWPQKLLALLFRPLGEPWAYRCNDASLARSHLASSMSLAFSVR